MHSSARRSKETDYCKYCIKYWSKCRHYVPEIWSQSKPPARFRMRDPYPTPHTRHANEVNRKQY